MGRDYYLNRQRRYAEMSTGPEVYYVAHESSLFAISQNGVCTSLLVFVRLLRTRHALLL